MLPSFPINLQLPETSCPTCKTPWGEKLHGSLDFFCPNCKKGYPLIANQIPIFLPNPHAYLNHTQMAFHSVIRKQEELITTVKENISANSHRKELLQRMLDAHRFHLQYLQSIHQDLLPFINNKYALDKNAAKPRDRYAYDFQYLRRDWCGLAEGEAEIKRLIDVFREGVIPNLSDTGSAAVLGAGTGRLAWEMCSHFGHVLAVDTSYTMVRMFYDLLEKELDFFELNPKNAYKRSDMVIERKASIANGTLESPLENSWKLSYMIADALNLPVANDSLSAVVSVYFTDVLPFRKLIKEIKRVLKPGGIFYHFGPLQYHFKEWEDMLSAEEITGLLMAEGFEIVQENWVQAAHLFTPHSAHTQMYDNWVLIGRKE